LVTVEDGNITGETSVTLHRLFRMVHQYQPDILAVDSIQEVAHHTQDLYRFLESLPPKTKFVSVTGGEQKTGLIEIARRYNLSFDKFDPFGEARAIAWVAYHGAGVEVVAFEKETEIVVSRNRSPGKGGWSQNRYARKIHGNVLSHARAIDQELKMAGLDYWKKEFKAFGGLSRVLFHVRATREEIPVSPSRGGDVQIRIIGRRLERIRYVPLSGKPRHLIIGIDPGTTIGIAALNLDGELVRIHSSRQMGMSDVIEFLYMLGKPLIIATDVSPMPFSVEKIRRAFQAVAYIPRQDISVNTKYELAGKYGYGNDHERDALTAAIEAFRYWNHKWAGIIRRIPPGVNLEDVKAGFTRGQTVEQILESRSHGVKPREDQKPAISLGSGDERIRVLEGNLKDLRMIVSDLQADNNRLRQMIASRNQQIQSLKESLKAGVCSDPEVKKRDLIIENLKHRLRQEEKNSKKLSRRLKRIKETETGQEEGNLPIRVLEDLSRENIRVLTSLAGLKKDEPVYVKSVGSWGRASLQELHDAGVSALILGKKSGEMNEPLQRLFHEFELPFVSENDVPVRIKGEVGVCVREHLEEAVDAWQEEHSRYHKEQKEEMLDDLMKEYRAERERERRKHG
jgi:predicted RNase H-like nuclease (RuvC/YqgF family)